MQEVVFFCTFRVYKSFAIKLFQINTGNLQLVVSLNAEKKAAKF